MSQSDAPRTIELKTVAGRKCSVDPPFTVQHLVDVAVEQLHFERESVRLFVGSRPIYARRRGVPEPDQRLLEQVTPPQGECVLVMGRPALRKTAHAARAKFVDAAKETHAAQQAVGDKKPLFVPVVSAVDDGMSIRVGPNDKGLYRFLKPLVFMLGRRGLRHLFLLVKGQRGHFPESFQDHPVMVCIVEYVDRDPGRLKDVLTTIQEEEPGLLRWIETHDEFFLSVINSPPQWRDETSPMWLIRHAKKVYSMEATKTLGKGNFARTLTTGHLQTESFSEDFTGAGASPMEEGLLLDMDVSETSSNLESSWTASLEGTSSTAAMESTNTNTRPEEDPLIDPLVQELQLVYRAWEIAKERRSSAVRNSAAVEGLKNELSCRLRDVHHALLRTMESYLMTPD
ncbi:uncharacterized protein Tco025E_08326 [Trypanosoma conorhini]|uniref:XPC-binding domain-containing protein n=1 Tax=Trypanosoma conorhini TaxID=83891 RepID=A0A422NB84_9TRYP|nr:uncharacterized protein Tco025E_08326 [Trypanosoma conorhini]RNF02740.1 hypothetical protein Tco025E_08326 [Trypanosoma conorhini]